MIILLTAFVYSCYNPNPTEVIYEGTNDNVVYTYDTVECGSDYYESDYSDSEYRDDEGQDEEVKETKVFIPWSPQNKWLFL